MNAATLGYHTTALVTIFSFGRLFMSATIMFTLGLHHQARLNYECPTNHEMGEITRLILCYH